MPVSDAFVFIDIETTGLREREDKILEIGMYLVGLDYQVIEGRSWMVCDDETMHLINNGLDPFILNMHTRSGLLDDITRAMASPTRPNCGSPEDVEIYAFNLALQWGADAKTPICGSSVHFDRKFMDVHMPALNGLFSYRNIDSSSDMEFLKVKYPNLWAKVDGDPAKIKRDKHRVDEDVHDSINLQMRLDKHIFNPVADLHV